MLQLCKDCIEEVGHLFVCCPVSSVLWEEAGIRWSNQFPHFSGGVDVVSWCVNLASQEDLMRVSVMLWSIWNSRNKIIFYKSLSQDTNLNTLEVLCH